MNWESKKVLLPILGRPYGEALEKQELVLRVENGRPVLQYYGQKLPIAAGAENLQHESVRQRSRRQHYRLAYWRKPRRRHQLPAVFRCQRSCRPSRGSR